MATVPSNTGHLFNEHQVAEMLSVSVSTVRRWRLLRQGPRFLKLGSAVRYRREDMDAWLASRPTGGTDSPPVEAATVQPVSVSGASASHRGGNRNA
jgi:excisionase family DNA binding protein